MILQIHISPKNGKYPQWTGLCPQIEGTKVMGYVPDRCRHFAAADLAVVQCSGTTTLEPLALQKPFFCFPLEGHFQQKLALAGKLKMYGAMNEMIPYETTPEMLATAMKMHRGRK